ncbi:integrase, catalytic region, zinc finger, CCHC-type containing protein [Tanacetum coccineum]
MNNIYKMPLEQFQVNTKFLDTLPNEWSKFVTDVKLVKDLHTTNVDQLHAYLEQHERHTNEVRLMHERNSDPLALVASHQITQSPYQTHQHTYQNTQLQPPASTYPSPQMVTLFKSSTYSTHQSSTPLSVMIQHAEYDESNTYMLERFNTTAGNPVKKILLKLNLSNHRSILTDSKKLSKDGDGGTDKAKTTRKWLKPGKHEHGNGRARKKPGGSYQSQKVNSQNTRSYKPRIATLAIRVSYQSNPTACIEESMIRGMEGYDQEERICMYQCVRECQLEKKYILVIVDDYSRFTWVKCLRSKDEAPAFIINFLKMIQVRLKETVRRIRTDNGTEFVNQTLREYYEKVGISHETSIAQLSP